MCFVKMLSRINGFRKTYLLRSASLLPTGPNTRQIQHGSKQPHNENTQATLIMLGTEVLTAPEAAVHK